MFLDIAGIINKRYSTNPSEKDVDKIINNITERFNIIMKKYSPFYVKLNISHTENASLRTADCGLRRKYSIKKIDLRGTPPKNCLYFC